MFLSLEWERSNYLTWLTVRPSESTLLNKCYLPILMLQGLYFQGPQGEQVKAEVATTYPPLSQSWFQLTKTRPAEKQLELNFLFFFQLNKLSVNDLERIKLAISDFGNFTRSHTKLQVIPSNFSIETHWQVKDTKRIKLLSNYLEMCGPYLPTWHIH